MSIAFICKAMVPKPKRGKIYFSYWGSNYNYWSVRKFLGFQIKIGKNDLKQSLINICSLTPYCVDNLSIPSKFNFDYLLLTSFDQCTLYVLFVGVPENVTDDRRQVCTVVWHFFILVLEPYPHSPQIIRKSSFGI